MIQSPNNVKHYYILSIQHHSNLCIKIEFNAWKIRRLVKACSLELPTRNNRQKRKNFKSKRQLIVIGIVKYEFEIMDSFSKRLRSKDLT